MSQEIIDPIFMFLSVRANHLPEAQDKWNWIRTSENYERICL